ncbi:MULTISPECIES: hypothetical protein [Methylosinus]|uniref:Uncharacterized protein n=1 Tax=Methylosinus trichosporium (strain ATCC 35070 / NCIMB 11131 / UNIQEM 75 / OB3b) TaxID=595536 RepID=A0A2D2CXG5_METT3|nr:MULTISPECIES: hypothetical protein [Methylosinus]ATQ67437.1 hypothetical protein CQW49_05660 [Methylosinus trichosporium OB3b]OBS53930.1 hypothetical protein A8B73_03315 [Methylosinus sp. 3S-1]
MSISTSLLILISIVFVGVRVVSYFLSADLDRLEKLAKWSGKYSSSARELLSMTDAMPPSVVRELGFWNEAVVDRRFPFLLAVALSNKRRELLNGANLSSTTDDDDKRIFMQKNPALEDIYYDTLVYALMTIGYSHWLWGLIIRTALADIVAEHKKRRLKSFSSAVQQNVKLTRASSDCASFVAST